MGQSPVRDAGLAEATTPAGEGRLPSRAEIERIKADANFPAALKLAATGFVDLYQKNRLLNRLINDRARTLFGFAMLDLHYSGQGDGQPGFTVTRAQEFCVKHGLCSAGRAAAMIALMRFAGYVEVLPLQRDRRLRLYGITPKLLATHHERWRRMFEAIATVQPDMRAAIAALDRPSFTPAYARILTEDFRAGVRVLAGSAPELGLFAERNSGMIILFSLIAAAADDTVPPSRPLPVSISALANRFAVSRAHVMKLLRDATDEGFVSLSNGNGYVMTFEPKLKEAVQNFFATAFLYLDRCAMAAVAAMPERD